MLARFAGFAHPRSSMQRCLPAVFILALFACSDDDGSSGAADARASDDATSGPDVRPDAAVDRPDARAEAGLIDAGEPDAGRDDGGADASGDAMVEDAGRYTPGDPPSGDPELTITSAMNPDPQRLKEQSDVRQGDLLLWECGSQEDGIGHIWSGFRLVTPEVTNLTSEEQRQLELGTRLVMLDVAGTELALPDSLVFAFDFGVPGEVTIDGGAVQLIINRARVGQTTRPSDIADQVDRYRVEVPVPGGTTFVREAFVTTEVPDTQAGC